jgi:hypothetical protein
MHCCWKQWDDLVYAFCLGVPCKTHRRRLRSYENCFVAKKAVDWLHEYLMMSPNFNTKHDITRVQAVQLLRKFVQHDIIVRVDGKSCGHDMFHEFEDNKDLYRLCINESRTEDFENIQNNQENFQSVCNFMRSSYLREPKRMKRRSKSGRS